jgi:4-amino-4-deoxy-L-arabinose transferase-like glycosyltransferase
MRLSAVDGPRESKPSVFVPQGGVFDLSVITFLWVFAVAMVNPVGDFPLNDDWSFGLAVKHLVENGGFQPTGWTATTLITQTLWGALFSLPFGFSFTAVRFSTLSLSLLGILGAYLLGRQLGGGRFPATAFALTLAFNPIYFALSHTFMTDVPFLALTIAALYLLIRYLQTESIICLLLGTIASAAAILCRQIGLFIPIAFSLSLVLRGGLSRRRLFRENLPLLTGICALVAFNSWLESTVGLPDLYGYKTRNLVQLLATPLQLFRSIFRHISGTLLYMGVSLSPLFIFWLPKFCSGKSPMKSRLPGLAFAAFLVLSSVGLLLAGRVMPLFSQNVLIPGGIGPTTLHDTYILELPHMSPLPFGFWLAVTIAGILGGGFILASLVAVGMDFLPLARSLRKGDENKTVIFFLLSGAAVYLPPVLAAADMFDRYLLPVILLYAGAMLIYLHNPPSENLLQRAGAIVILLLFAFFSVATTRDYLSWNRARWTALRNLMAEERVSPARIDGGFEFNGLYLYSPDSHREDPSKSWWWVSDDEYLITLGEVPGYSVVKKYPFTRLLPPEEKSIFVLHREEIGGQGNTGKKTLKDDHDLSR